MRDLRLKNHIKGRMKYKGMNSIIFTNGKKILIKHIREFGKAYWMVRYIYQ